MEEKKALYDKMMIEWQHEIRSDKIRKDEKR